MENKFLCCSHNSTHNDHWFTFNFLLHCCSMHRPEGASYLGVRPPLDRPQLCWWLPQLSQILPTAPLRVPPPHPAGTAGQTAVGISRRQLLLILLHARLLSLKICGAQHSHGTATVQALLLLWNGRLMVGDLARSERLRPPVSSPASSVPRIPSSNICFVPSSKFKIFAEASLRISPGQFSKTLFDGSLLFITYIMIYLWLKDNDTHSWSGFLQRTHFSFLLLTLFAWSQVPVRARSLLRDFHLANSLPLPPF